MEDIEILEEVIELYKNFNELPYKFNKHIIRAIENLINKNKELQSDLYSANCIISEQINVIRDSTLKSKIEEKIEKLKKDYKKALEENSTKAFVLKCQIEILEKLLQKEQE